MILIPLVSLAILSADPVVVPPPPPGPIVEGHAEVRARGEGLHELDLDPNARATASPQYDGDRVLLRTRASLQLGYDVFGAFVQLQDSRTFGDEATTVANFGNLDLHQGFVEVRSPAGIPMIARLGRMELAYGDQRLIGNFGWDNVGRAFDAALLRATLPANITVDGFWSRLHQDPRASFTRSLGDDFFGLYGSMKREKITVDAYGLMLYDRGGRQDNNGDGIPETFRFPGGGELYLWTPGVRVDAKPWSTLHLNGEFAYQLGKRGTATISAYALHGSADYTFAAPLSPKLIAGYDRASGDSSTSDTRWGTFENLFPTNHDKYGLIDLAAWKNLSDPYVGVALKPQGSVTVGGTVHFLSRANIADTFYRANGTALRDRALVLQRGVTARDVGTELDVTLGWEPVKGFTTLLGYSQLWSGDFLEQTAAPGVTTPDPRFLYLQLTAAL